MINKYHYKQKNLNFKKIIFVIMIINLKPVIIKKNNLKYVILYKFLMP